MALALAEALPARGLFEFASPHASGLAGAATDEQGERHGWRVGRRGELELARRLDPGAAAGVDVGDAVVDLGAWAGDAPEHDLDRLVVVAGCSIPSIRRLEACLQSVNASTVLIPVITRAGRRLSRELLGASGPALRAAFKAGAVHVVPQCRRLLFTGLTPDPLPRSLRQSAAGIALALKESS